MLAERKKNVLGSFKVKTNPGYNSIAIVDDIITTGSTVNEMAKLLKQAGIKHVSVWACAHAG